MERYMIGLIIGAILRPLGSSVSCCDVVSLTFPSGFRIGTGSSAYQIEGAWNASDKGESNYDFWVHNSTEWVADGSNGDVTCNSYHKYKEDVAWIKSIGLDFYRFSISWSRVLPTGFANKISEDGIQYYKNLTAELVANDIEPIATIYHWDHPLTIEDMGGWTNELIVDWFVDYARVLFEALGDSVKIWVTVNEPNVYCNNYESVPPGKPVYGIGAYLCVHNTLKAHAKTYRMYDEEFRATQQGQIGIVTSTPLYISENSSDTESPETAHQFDAGWIAHPIYFGDYPAIMKDRVALVSEYEGYPRSRLPVFSDEWIDIINGTADYFGVNHYTTNLVSPDPDEELGIYNSDNGLIISVNPSWPSTIATWFYEYPPGFGDLLRFIRDKYGNPPVWVMENGYPDAGGSNDYNRISYFYEYLREMLIAIKRDGCNVVGYAIWTLLDNWEWSSGYTHKFGIVSVDFDDPDRTRSAKLSTFWWRSVATSRRLQSVPTNSTSQTKTVPWNR